MLIIWRMIAFYGRLPIQELGKLLISDYLIRMVYAVIVVIPAAMIVAGLKKSEKLDIYDTNTNFNMFSLSLKDKHSLIFPLLKHNMPFANVNGINIFYEIQGEGEPLVLIGGLTRNHTVWRDIASVLSKKYSVLVFDNRGAGQGDKPDDPYSIELLANDLAMLMDAINLPRAYIIGHSMGAFMAMYLAAKHPEKVSKLVLCSACVRQGETGISYLTERVTIAEKQLPIDEVLKSALPWIYSKTYLETVGIEAIIEREKVIPILSQCMHSNTKLKLVRGMMHLIC